MPNSLPKHCNILIACITLGAYSQSHSQSTLEHFYPRDAMLARVIAIATCPSVRPSVTRWYCQNEES